MSIDDYPINARTGMMIAMTKTYIELVTLMRATDPQGVMIIGRMIELAPIERDSLLLFLQERQIMLERTLRDQLRMLLAYHRQEADLVKAKAKAKETGDGG